MIYEVDKDAQERRMFSKKLKYSQVARSNLDQIVYAFRQRIQHWYLDPARELAKITHFAFCVMALNCLLIDTLSQFVSGKVSSDDEEFKKFVRDRLPKIYSDQLPTPIQHDDGKRQTTLRDIADVLYHGFRCGILHQAHITPYGVVDPEASDPVRVVASGLVKYKSKGGDCPAVIVNPLKLLDDMVKVFKSYLDELKNRDPKYDPLRTNFKSKFSASFGIDIHAAA